MNDIPKKAADFEAFLEESVCGKDKFSLCINAMTLLLKGGTDQRAILLICLVSTVMRYLRHVSGVFTFEICTA